MSAENVIKKLSKAWAPPKLSVSGCRDKFRLMYS